MSPQEGNAEDVSGKQNRGRRPRCWPLVIPIFFGFPPHRWRRRVLGLEPRECERGAGANAGPSSHLLRQNELSTVARQARPLS